MEEIDKIEKHFRLSIDQKKGLKKLGIENLRDLLYYFPSRYDDASHSRAIGNIKKGEQTVIYGKITGLKTLKAFKTKIPMSKGTITDGTGSIGVVWFNQPYLAKMLKEGDLIKADGKISEGKYGPYISNPVIEKVSSIPLSIGDNLFNETENAFISPIYSETRGISTLWLFHSIQKILKLGIQNSIKDPVPEEILKKYSLPSLSTALVWIHNPKKKDDYEIARKRFAFEEIFLIQVAKQQERINLKNLSSESFKEVKERTEKFIKNLSFDLTNSQKRSIDEICIDLEKGSPMSRLLEGDVGSGKTAVAAATSYAVISYPPKGREFGHCQVAYMAPTEILAEQHFKSFIELFRNENIEIGLVTGSVAKKFPSKINPNDGVVISKTQLLKWVKEGKISILIGTHAIIQKKVEFKNLALSIIDEQHRFGVNQRKKLARKDGIVPHLLSMTATPIPRTLALTIYGDLDLSILDEMPKGRQTIETKIIPPNERERAYEFIKKELDNGRQAYVICPRIDDPDPTKEKALNVKSVKSEALRLKKEVFKDHLIGILHSKMKPKDKEKVMSDFNDKKIDILVSTSVVEVGVNVPNASVMIIEGSERFGLSQLHQLRGRIVRGNHKPYCFVFTNSENDTSIERLRAFVNAKNGFELSEMDLKIRGIGELSGGKQWGVSDIAMEALKNPKLVIASREEAIKLVSKNPSLSNYPDLKSIIEKKESVHFE